ncbi:glycosyltransferase family 2 protein [Marinibaculum pumilum]|uniref:Glycosyltransferase family 2 protein n=1 Tax=Marinibaculum pumilum TaxID=1766165 RepID=A0ABV7KXV3_9PROT
MSEPEGCAGQLSVVIPNYNHGRFLETAVAAHLGQRRPPLEVIVVDDASTDDSVAVVTALQAQEPRIRLLRQDRNRRVNAAMNRGLAEARGDYVCFSAADDLVGPDFAAENLALLDACPQAAFAFSDPAELLGESGIVREFPLYLSTAPAYLEAERMIAIMRRAFFTISSNTAVYRRDRLQEIGGFAEDLEWYADWWVNYVLAYRHGAGYVPRRLAWFRVSPQSYSAKGVRDAAAQRAVTDRVLAMLDEPRYADVAPLFRRSGLMTEFSLRGLGWLLSDRRGRRYLTPHLALRMGARGLWDGLRPLAPLGARRWLRRRASGLAGQGRHDV